jgi:hypothetical protein
MFILLEVIDLVSEYRETKSFRAGTWEPTEKKSTVITLSKWLRGLLLYAGLFLMLAGYMAGVVIWVGTIICWFCAGIIAREVAGIPIRMGYGGWKVYRPRRRGNRRH